MTADELLVVRKAIGRCEEYESCWCCPYKKACNELVEKANEQRIPTDPTLLRCVT